MSQGARGLLGAADGKGVDCPRSGPVTSFQTSDLHDCKRTDLCFRTLSSPSFVTTVEGHWRISSVFCEANNASVSVSSTPLGHTGVSLKLTLLKGAFYEILFFKSENALSANENFIQNF